MNADNASKFEEKEIFESSTINMSTKTEEINTLSSSIFSALNCIYEDSGINNSKEDKLLNNTVEITTKNEFLGETVAQSCSDDDSSTTNEVKAQNTNKCNSRLNTLNESKPLHINQASSFSNCAVNDPAKSEKISALNSNTDFSRVLRDKESVKSNYSASKAYGTPKEKYVNVCDDDNSTTFDEIKIPTSVLDNNIYDSNTQVKFKLLNDIECSAIPKEGQYLKHIDNDLIVQKETHAPNHNDTVSKIKAPFISKNKKSRVSKKTSSTVKSKMSPTKTNDLTMLMQPLKYGFKREVVYRNVSAKKICDIYYFAPSGPKLRSMKDIAKYLKAHPNVPFTLEHFSMLRKGLGFNEEYEKVRNAKISSSNFTSSEKSNTRNEGIMRPN